MHSNTTYRSVKRSRSGGWQMCTSDTMFGWCRSARMRTSRKMRFAFSNTSKMALIFLIATRLPVRWSTASTTDPYEPLPSARFSSKRLWSTSHDANCGLTRHVAGPGIVYENGGIVDAAGAPAAGAAAPPGARAGAAAAREPSCSTSIVAVGVEMERSMFRCACGAAAAFLGDG